MSKNIKVQKENPYMSTSQVMELLGVSKSTMYRFIKSGYFLSPTIIGPRTWRWDKNEVEAWIEAQRV